MEGDKEQSEYVKYRNNGESMRPRVDFFER